MGKNKSVQTIYFSMGLWTLLLALLLSACDIGGIGGTSPTPTVAPTPTPALVSYHGSGYTINYPKGWTAKNSTDGVTFSDPTGIAYFAVRTSPDPGGFVSSENQVQLALQAFKSNAKNVHNASVPASTSIGGENWSQGASTGDLVPSGQTASVNVKIIVAADTHPANSPSTRAYVIAYATGSQVFDLANAAYFQPMLQSFKFA